MLFGSGNHFDPMSFGVHFAGMMMCPRMFFICRQRQFDAVWLILTGLTGASQPVYGNLRCFPGGKRIQIAVRRPEDRRGHCGDIPSELVKNVRVPIVDAVGEQDHEQVLLRIYPD